MTTTAQWLEAYPGGKLALSLHIDGHDTIYGTDSMPNTWSLGAAPYDEYLDPTGGLMAEGTIEAEINLYTPDLEADTLSFTVVDPAGTLAGSLLREGKSTGHTTYLTTSVVAGDTGTIFVKDTTGFAASHPAISAWLGRMADLPGWKCAYDLLPGKRLTHYAK